MERSNVILSEEFINQLVSELDTSDIIGITLGGSYARGEGTPFSDVDMGCFFAEQVQPPPKRLFYRESHLISAASLHVSDAYARLANPPFALFLGCSKRRILLDKDGSVRKLQQDIEAFTWELLHEAANNYVSRAMMLLAEPVQKILGELYRQDRIALAYITEKLITTITEVVAVHCRMLITSEHTYYQQVQENMGLNSSWTRLHLAAIGINIPQNDTSPLVTRAHAALQLYRETLVLVHAAMSSDHLQVAEQVVKMW